MNDAGMRKAAVLLASLHPGDRRWIRARLPRAHWRGLRRLMDELRGIAAGDRTLWRDAALDAHEARAEPPAPDVLLAGLHGLDAVWAARVLAACAPDHRELVQAGYTPDECQAMERALEDAPGVLPPKLAQALAVAVRARGERRLEPGDGA